MEVIQLEKTFNTRDFKDTNTIDGRKIKPNRLIRSGHLHKISENDIETLKKHQLRIVVDFRANKEFVNLADKRIEGVQYINLPALKKQNDKSDGHKSTDSNLLMLTDKNSGGKQFLLQTYRDLVTSEEGINAYKSFFKIVLENKEGAILFHCSQGKDRAGLAAFLLQQALGVSYQDSLKDYLLTNYAMDLKINKIIDNLLKESNNDESRIDALNDVFHAYEEYLQASINQINETYGSIDNFLRNTLDVDVETLKENYLY